MPVDTVGYANVISSNSPVASGLHAESEFDETQIETNPAMSLNPAMTYALLALIGCVLNFVLLIGVGIYCARNRKRDSYDDHAVNYDVDGALVTTNTNNSIR